MSQPTPPPDVRDQVRAYYEKQTLRPEKMNAILRDIGEAGPASDAGRAARPWAGWSTQRWSAAAALLLVFVLGGVWAAWPGGHDLTRVVAQEIALNHNKTLKPDYQAVVFSDLSKMSDKLGFTPIEPASLAGRGLILEGGRYCSVQGCMAAQLRVVDADGGAYTLYQVRPDERLAKLDPATATVDGVDVELWSEAGLVMGLARSR
ncbi:MAG: hypothetical protein AAF593_14935 [Planctomycetota bacterium]